jgi:hypothetical protein
VLPATPVWVWCSASTWTADTAVMRGEDLGQNQSRWARAKVIPHFELFGNSR